MRGSSGQIHQETGPATVSEFQRVHKRVGILEKSGPLPSGVSPGAYGDGTHVAVVTVDRFGVVTGIALATITGAAPTGAAGGALAGTYPNPSFAVDMATQAELDAQVSALNVLIAAAKQPYQASFSAATSFTILASTHLRGTGLRQVVVANSSGVVIGLNVTCATNGDVTITSDGPAIAIKVAVY